MNTPHGKERLHAPQTKQPTRFRGAKIHSRGEGKQGRLCTLGDSAGRVWSHEIRSHSTATSIEKTEQEVVSSERYHTGILDAQLAPDLFITMRQLFWRKICWKTTRKAPNDIHKRALQNLERLEGQNIPRYGYRLGLRQQQGELSMLGYVVESLTRFQHKHPCKP